MSMLTSSHLSGSLSAQPTGAGQDEIAVLAPRCRPVLTRETAELITAYVRVKQQSESAVERAVYADMDCNQFTHVTCRTHTCCEMERRTASGFDSLHQPDVHVRKAGCLAQRASSTPTPAQVRDHSCSPLSVCLCVRPAVCT
eukprot:m.344229 g.344229  ORF g.344229 m.344229 type:complete len:142 (-) comp55788_c0_seq28:446-871(-)